MSRVNYDDATATCKVCREMIFLEEEPVHFKCISAREKSLVDMIMSLHCELNAMKKSFKSVECALETLEAAFNLKNMDRECDSDPEIPSRTLRKTTIEKSQACKRERANKTARSPRITSGSQGLAPISPLVISNGTSSPQNVTVTRNKRNRTSTSFGLPLHGPKSPPSLSKTIVDVEPQLEVIEEPTSNVSSQTFANIVASNVNDALPQQKVNNNNILVTVDPSKNVFLSGLSPEMTESNVNQYVNMMFNTQVSVKVKKMRLRDDADHSSFIILTGRNKVLFECLIKPSFWPPNTIVDQFIEKENFRSGRSNHKRLKPSLVAQMPHGKTD